MGEHIIIAGIVAKDQPVLQKYFKSKGLRKDSIVTFLTVKEKRPIYKQPFIEDFIYAFAQTVFKKNPKTIRVIYVSHEGFAILEELFFPFADIQPSNETKTNDENIQNHSRGIEELGDELLQVIRKGLKIKQRPSRRHYLLLPNKNFMVEGREFCHFLHKYYFGSLDESIFSAIKKNKKLNCFQDSRDLVFPVTKMNEGNLRCCDAKKNPRHFLKGIYRLGMLWDAGFHFDVKHISKPNLSSFNFICSVKEKIDSSQAKYVNIYLNDFIRVPRK